MSARASIGLAAALVAALVAVQGAAHAGAGPGATTGAGEGTVELLECNRGKRAADRSAVFRGTMSALPGAAAMRMRFRLSERLGSGPWRSRRAPGLERWRHAQPGVAVFAYRQRIAALEPGTTYRVWVTFQWLDASGARIARQVALSRPCRQGGALPELTVRRVTVDDGPAPDIARYRVVVANRGRAPATGFGVLLRVDGAIVDELPISRLGAKANGRLDFYGPRCITKIAVRIDRSGRVRERDRRDNFRLYGCDGTPRGS